jgi:hypothetical protein
VWRTDILRDKALQPFVHHDLPGAIYPGQFVLRRKVWSPTIHSRKYQPKRAILSGKSLNGKCNIRKHRKPTWNGMEKLGGDE